MFKNGDPDELLEEVILYLHDTDYITSPVIQRQFPICYARSARILDQLEELNFISSHRGSKPRKVIHKNIKYNEK